MFAGDARLRVIRSCRMDQGTPIQPLLFPFCLCRNVPAKTKLGRFGIHLRAAPFFCTPKIGRTSQQCCPIANNYRSETALVLGNESLPCVDDVRAPQIRNCAANTRYLILPPHALIKRYCRFKVRYLLVCRALYRRRAMCPVRALAVAHPILPRRTPIQLYATRTSASVPIISEALRLS
jgi:hypothetical protein